MRMPRTTIRGMMLVIAVSAFFASIACRTYPVSSLYGGGLRSLTGSITWSDGSFTHLTIRRRSVSDRWESASGVCPLFPSPHLGGLVTSLEWSDGSVSWYFTPLEFRRH